MRLVFRQRSQDDLDGIFDFIAQHDPEAATRITEELIGVCELIREYPELGMQRKLRNISVRMHVHRGYRIFYRFDEKMGTVEIIRFLHHSLDERRQELD